MRENIAYKNKTLPVLSSAGFVKYYNHRGLPRWLNSTMQETWVQSLAQKDPWKNEMTTHSSILAWEITWTEESDGLYSME